MGVLFSSLHVAVVKVAVLIIVQPDFLPKRLRYEQNIRIRKVIAVVKEHPFEPVEIVVCVDVEPSLVNYLVELDELLQPVIPSLALGRAVDYLKVEVCLIVLSYLVLDLEEASSIEYYLFLAKSHEKPDY